MTSCVAWVGKTRGTLAEDQIHAASTRRAKSTRLAWELSVKCRYSTTSKATGPDNIPAALLIYCAPYISSLSNLFNNSLKLGRIPTAWKISNIVPIPKSGPLKEVTNYRPICLLGIVSKVLERCIYNRLIDHVSTHLHHFQFGFLRAKSTSSQLLHVLHEIGKLLDKRIQTDIVYLDFAKAFDRVDHQLLLKKLKNFGVGENLLEWFHSYLKDRCQRVVVHGKASQELPVLSGIPQGSILGPLLFFIYVNDLPHITNTSSVALYADDNKYYCAIRSGEDVNCLQSDLHIVEIVEQWCREWRMDLNQSKWWSPQSDQECKSYRVSLPSDEQSYKQHQWAKRSWSYGHL